MSITMKQEKPKYFLYARKSSESEDRQIQSINDQIDRLRIIAENQKIDIVEVLIESKSAKKPNNRPIFSNMVERIQNGEAEGILCWQINRLSRNPIDSGYLQWLLQQNILKSIQTVDREYVPCDNALLFSVESGVANQFILDLRKNVIRGMDSKAQSGWMPNMAPLGYLNDKETKTIVTDPERFQLVRKMFDLMLTGSNTPRQILDMANTEWGFRTRKTKNAGDNPLSHSGIHRIFSNPFYTGIVQYNGKQFEGKHESMITFEEYDRVQRLLGERGKPRKRKHDHAFTCFIRCEECGCYYTAETKNKYIKSTKEV